MAMAPPGGDDRRMDPGASTPAYVAASASRVRRAAVDLREWSGSADALPSLPVTLAHVEDALDQLAIGLQRMAEAVSAGDGDERTLRDESTLDPEARALRWQLRAVADALIDARDGCPAASEWARRLVDDAATGPLQATATRGASSSAVTQPAAIWSRGPVAARAGRAHAPSTLRADRRILTCASFTPR